jgi:Zn-dependent protease with chaperone function
MGKPESSSGGTVRLMLILLAIPLVAFAAGRGIEWKLDSTLRSALLEKAPDKAAEISHISLASWCAQPDIRNDPAIADACNLSDNMGLLELGAVIAVALGIGLVVAIKIAGKLSKGRRTLLLLLFAPGLHMTMLALSVLMLLHAALGMAAIYYGESELIGQVHWGIMLGLGIGALFGVLTVIRAQFSTFKKATTVVLGKKLERDTNPKLWQFVNGLADKMAAQRPDAIVAGLEPNFYVTEANVICLDGKLKGRTMFVSLPLCRILSLDEMKAVLGHELAHYKGLDTKFSKRFYPIYRGATEGLVNLASGFSGKGGASQLVLLPAFVTFSYFLNSFSEAEKAISRDRELAADKEAARIDSARNLAVALVKLHAFSGAWLAIRKEMKLAIEAGKQFTNVSLFFANVTRRMAEAEGTSGVSEEGPIHPTDTHPPLSQRLTNLNLTLEDVRQYASDLSPAEPAVNVIENLEGLEQELTDAEHAMMIKTGQAYREPSISAEESHADAAQNPAPTNPTSKD